MDWNSVNNELAVSQQEQTVVPIPEDMLDVNPSDKVKEKPYHLRTVKADDLFVMVNILKKINIKEFTSCLQTPAAMQMMKSFRKDSENLAADSEKSDAQPLSEEDKKDILLVGGMSIALDVASKILENLPKCKDDLYALLANVSGMKVQEIANLDVDIFFEMLVDFIKKPEFEGFIKVASRLVK